jgi:hypothetical protein
VSGDIETIETPLDPFAIVSAQVDRARRQLDGYADHVAYIASTGANSCVEEAELVRREAAYKDALAALDAKIEEVAAAATAAVTP